MFYAGFFRLIANKIPHFSFYFSQLVSLLLLVLSSSPVASPPPPSLLPTPSLSLSLSRNPIDPNGLISGVCAITHMRTRGNLSHFWRKLISRNKEPSVFPPTVIRTHSTSGAGTNPSVPPSSVYYSLYVALITLLFGNNSDPAALSPGFPPSWLRKKRRWSFIRNEWALNTVVFRTTTHSAYGALYQSLCRNVSPPFVYDIAGNWEEATSASGRWGCLVSTAWYSQKSSFCWSACPSDHLLLDNERDHS